MTEPYSDALLENLAELADQAEHAPVASVLTAYELGRSQGRRDALAEIEQRNNKREEL